MVTSGFRKARQSYCINHQLKKTLQSRRMKIILYSCKKERGARKRHARREGATAHEKSFFPLSERAENCYGREAPDLSFKDRAHSYEANAKNTIVLQSTIWMTNDTNLGWKKCQQRPKIRDLSSLKRRTRKCIAPSEFEQEPIHH